MTLSITKQRLDELLKTDKAIQRTQHKIDILKENRAAIIYEIDSSLEDGEFFITKNGQQEFIFIGDVDGHIQKVEVV